MLAAVSDLASFSLAVFSLPMPIVLLELLEPHPAIMIVAASVARPRTMRERLVRRFMK